jgi:hypothetical protein
MEHVVLVSQKLSAHLHWHDNIGQIWSGRDVGKKGLLWDLVEFDVQRYMD